MSLVEKELLQTKLKRGYFFVLLIMVVMITISSFIAVNSIIGQEHDSRNINISGMQRMLSQKIALHAEQINSENLAQVNYARKRMLASAIRFLENHKLLVSEQTNPTLSAQISAKYFDPELNLDQKFRKFANDAIAYSNRTNPNAHWNYSNQEIEFILLELDSFVTLFEEEASKNVGNVFFVELGLWITSMLLIISLYFILVRRISANLE